MSFKIATIIGIFITLLIGATLVTPFADTVAGVGGNVTGASRTVYLLLPLFFVIVLIMIAVKSIGGSK